MEKTTTISELKNAIVGKKMTVSYNYGFGEYSFTISDVEVDGGAIKIYAKENIEPTILPVECINLLTATDSFIIDPDEYGIPHDIVITVE